MKKVNIVDCQLIQVKNGQVLDHRKTECYGPKCKKCGWNISSLCNQCVLNDNSEKGRKKNAN